MWVELFEARLHTALENLFAVLCDYFVFRVLPGNDGGARYFDCVAMLLLLEFLFSGKVRMAFFCLCRSRIYSV